MTYTKKLEKALRREVLMRHIETHAPHGFGSNFEECPNVQCQEVAKLLAGRGRDEPDDEE